MDTSEKNLDNFRTDDNETEKSNFDYFHFT